MSGRKKGLGRGLSALMTDSGLTDRELAVPIDEDSKIATGERLSNLVDSSEVTPNNTDPLGVRTVAISRLSRNSAQPRRVFDRDKLDDLIASIQQKGVLQPILVRPLTIETEGTDFQIVAGERRWRAALKAGLTSIPIIIRDLSDRDVLEIGVIENVQRADLNPLEEALAYEQLIEEFGRTQAEIATSIGKSRVHVANTVRLTGLSERGRELLLDGQITAGHARALLAASDPDALAETIIKKGLSVRDAENWVKADKTPVKNSFKKDEKSADIRTLEQHIQDSLGYVADIRHNRKGGEIRLKYKDLEHMQALLTQLGVPQT